jgi:hypothetical protein
MRSGRCSRAGVVAGGRTEARVRSSEDGGKRGAKLTELSVEFQIRNDECPDATAVSQLTGWVPLRIWLLLMAGRA